MRPLLMLAVPLVLFVGGCTNLDAVKSASTKLVTASKNWDAVAGELNATCQRQQQYNKKLTDCASPAAATKGLKDANTIHRTARPRRPGEIGSCRSRSE